MQQHIVSYVESRRKLARTTEQRVIRFLKWDEQEYCEFKFESGLAYAEAITKGNEEQRQLLTRSDLYWGWWKNAWAMRDESFLRDFTVSAVFGRTIAHPSYARSAYFSVHDAIVLAAGTTEQARQMADSYANMIRLFNVKLRKNSKKVLL